ncbi:MAG: hypothetical protein KGN02_01425 [bacterium]|nr:hypothetical protein [bacterium]
MSGPLALSLEPRYDAHLLGVVGELVLDPMHFEMRGFLFDFLWYRSWFRNPDDSGIDHIANYGVLIPPRFDLFEAAWERWYAFDAGQLATKEREERFARAAPPLARAVSILRAQQRDDDPDRLSDASYRIILRDAEKDIRAYFSVGGHSRRKFQIEASPRFNLLSDEEFGFTQFGKRLRSIISPNGERVSAADAYDRGWDLRVSESSGLLGLALLDCEREYYLLVAKIIEPLLPLIERLLSGTIANKHRADLLRMRTWWRPFTIISCLMGPLDDTVRRMWDELASFILESMTQERREACYGLVQVRDLHETLFSQSKYGRKLRSMITIPNDVAKEFSKYSITDEYSSSDFHTGATPRQLVSVLQMLHESEFGYPSADTREELYWWFRDVARALDATS